MAATSQSRSGPSAFDKASLLRKHPLFRELGHEVHDWIAAYATTKHVQRGETIFVKGDVGTCLFAVTIAQPGSWRVLVHERRRDSDDRETHVPIAAGTASESDQGGFEFGGLSEGPLVEGTETAIRRAEQGEKGEELHKGRFEPFLAIAPAIRVAALWLKNLDDESGNADIILAIPPSRPELTPYQAMTAGEFLTVLRRLAEKLPAVDQTAK